MRGLETAGTPQEALCQVEKITVPVLMQFGDADTYKGFSDVEVGWLPPSPSPCAAHLDVSP